MRVTGIEFYIKETSQQNINQNQQLKKAFFCKTYFQRLLLLLLLPLILLHFTNSPLWILPVGCSSSLQCRSPTGLQVLPTNLLHHGFLSPSYTGPARRLLHSELPTGSQPPSHIHQLWHRVLHRLQVDLGSTRDLHGLQGHICITTICTSGCRGISTPAPSAPPLHPSPLIVCLFAELFLSNVLTQLFQLLLLSTFFPF